VLGSPLWYRVGPWPAILVDEQLVLVDQIPPILAATEETPDGIASL
jgi:hypothetical protein